MIFKMLNFPNKSKTIESFDNLNFLLIQYFTFKFNALCEMCSTWLSTVIITIIYYNITNIRAPWPISIFQFGIASSDADIH